MSPSYRGSFEKYLARIEGGHPDDIELADQSFGNTTPISIREMSADCVLEASNSASVTTNATTMAGSML